MHMLGIWGPLGKVSSRSLQPQLRLWVSDLVRVIESPTRILHYEGTIFGSPNQELIESPERLEAAFGVFTYVFQDLETRTVTLGTDRLGFSPLYFAEGPDEFTFSTSLTLIKCQLEEVTPDYDGWEELLMLGDLLGDRTTIRQVKRLLPGTRITLENHSVRFESFWEPVLDCVGTGGDRYVQVNNRLLVEALEVTGRGAAGPRVILLSGGHDSRRLAAGAEAAGLEYELVTQEVAGGKTGGDEEVLVAEKIASELGRPVRRVSLPSPEQSILDQRLRDHWLGFETHQHAWILPLIRSLSAGSLIYDGIAGDVTINAGFFKYLHPDLVSVYRDTEMDHAAQRISSHPSTSPLWKHKMPVESPLLDRVRAALLSLPETPQRLALYFLLNHTRRSIGLQARLYVLHGHRVCFPYLYHPLLRHSLSLPPEVHIQHLYQGLCIAALNPRLMRVPSTKHGSLEGMIVDRSKDRARRLDLAVRQRHVRSEIRDMFPGAFTRLAVFRAAARFGHNRLTDRLSWIADPLLRLSRFLDWLEDTDAAAASPESLVGLAPALRESWSGSPPFH